MGSVSISKKKVDQFKYLLEFRNQRHKVLSIASMKGALWLAVLGVSASALSHPSPAVILRVG
eukprot:1201013-Amphidinium_carterae.1